MDDLRYSTILFAVLGVPLFAINHLHTDILIGRRPNIAVLWRNCLPFSPIFLSLGLFDVSSSGNGRTYIAGLMISTAGSYASSSVDSFKPTGLSEEKQRETPVVANAMGNYSCDAANHVLCVTPRCSSTSNEVVLIR